MNKFEEKLRKFMSGRYGVDKLNQFLIYFSFIISLISLFIRNTSYRSFLGVIMWIMIGFALFRILSKNVTVRYQENIKFMKATKPIRAEIELLRLKFQNRDKVKYIKCPNCKTVVKVPKNAGKIKIRCRKCGNEFIKRV